MELAIDTNPLYITYIKNPPETIQIEAIKRNPYSILFIKNPTINTIVKFADLEASRRMTKTFLLNEEEQNILMQRSVNNIRYIKNPTEKTIKEALKQGVESDVFNMELDSIFINSVYIGNSIKNIIN